MFFLQFWTQGKIKKKEMGSVTPTHPSRILIQKQTKCLIEGSDKVDAVRLFVISLHDDSLAQDCCNSSSLAMEF